MRSGISVIILTTLALCAPAFAYDWTTNPGTGTPENPYQISEPNHLIAIGANPELLDKCFILTNDIIFDPNNNPSHVFTTALISPDLDETSMYFEGNAFTGALEGNGHIVSDLTIVGESYLGLFGALEENAQITNIGLIGVNIAGTDRLGGICGQSSKANISQCYADGEVNGSGEFIGGLVGLNAGEIDSCYSTCSVSGLSHIGSLIGYNYSTAYVNSCYATGLVRGENLFGGLTGYNTGTIKLSFWNIQTSGQRGSSGGKGLTTEQMKMLSVYQNANWADRGWTIDDGEDYPHLSWENKEGISIPAAQAVPFSGSGTLADPYLIDTAEEFAALSWYANVLNKHIQLTTDLDLSGINIYPISDLDRFYGVFDGDGHVISNASIDQPGSDFVGIFGYMSGRIENLGIKNASVNGRIRVGGLIGNNFYGTVENCYVTGNVTGYQIVGGLVGYHRYGTTARCYTNCTVSGIESSIGGFCGWQYGSSAVIEQSYSTGRTTGDYYVGGFLGEHSSGNLINCLWDFQRSNITIGVGQGSSTGLFGKNTQLMHQQTTFTAYGWDFDPNNGDPADWQMPFNDYPHLSWENESTLQKYSGGNGTYTAPYQIASKQDLLDLADNVHDYNKHFLLTENIDLAGEVFTTAVIAADQGGIYGSFAGDAFIGIFDGAGHLISNMTIDTSDADNNYLGLFGAIYTIAEIKNIGIVNYMITGGSNSSHIGGLCGYTLAGSTISNSFTSGSIIRGDRYIGGICGSNRKDCAIKYCYTTGEVNGDHMVGGVCGQNTGDITNAYSTAEVNGTTYTGGFCGSLNSEGGSPSSIKNCYSIGLVNGENYVGGFLGYLLHGTLHNCFWNTQTSETTVGIGNTTSSVLFGKSSDQMQQQVTFADYGWDFVGESTNGDNEIWRMCADGVDYPRLSWEFAQSGDFACGDGVGLEDVEALSQCWLAMVDLATELDDDADSVVGLSEIARVSEYWLQTNCDECGGVDTTGDETVDIADLADILNDWLRAVAPSCGTCDANGDERIDLNDLAVLSENWP